MELLHTLYMYIFHLFNSPGQERSRRINENRSIMLVLAGELVLVQALPKLKGNVRVERGWMKQMSHWSEVNQAAS
jgi:hypothetical protein